MHSCPDAAGQTNIGDVDCVPLSRLSSLLYLDLSDTHVGDTGVARLAPALRCLVVWRLSRLTRLSDDGLAAMAASAKGLRSLRVVYMRSCRCVVTVVALGFKKRDQMWKVCVAAALQGWLAAMAAATEGLRSLRVMYMRSCRCVVVAIVSCCDFRTFLPIF